MRTPGQRLAAAVGEIFGIDKRWIFACEADGESITIVRGVEGSDGGPALFVGADGKVDVARVSETFAFHTRPEEDPAP